jgi:hypothetical protein
MLDQILVRPILMAAVAQQIIGMLITRFSLGWILGTVFLMAVIFVTVGIAVAPSARSDGRGKMWFDGGSICAGDQSGGSAASASSRR